MAKYPNLKAELARKNLTLDDVAKLLGKTTRTAGEKVRGVTEFSLSEAMTIRDVLFPGCTLEYLFKPTQ